VAGRFHIWDTIGLGSKRAAARPPRAPPDRARRGSCRKKYEMICTIYWLEPEQGSWTFSVTDLTDSELQSICTWSKKEGAGEWGYTIPTIRLSVGDHWQKIPAEDFATAIRYNTEENVYGSDCPVFALKNIDRS